MFVASAIGYRLMQNKRNKCAVKFSHARTSWDPCWTPIINRQFQGEKMLHTQCTGVAWLFIKTLPPPWYFFLHCVKNITTYILAYSTSQSITKIFPEITGKTGRLVYLSKSGAYSIILQTSPLNTHRQLVLTSEYPVPVCLSPSLERRSKLLWDLFVLIESGRDVTTTRLSHCSLGERLLLKRQSETFRWENNYLNS